MNVPGNLRRRKALPPFRAPPQGYCRGRIFPLVTCFPRGNFNGPTAGVTRGMSPPTRAIGPLRRRRCPMTAVARLVTRLIVTVCLLSLAMTPPPHASDAATAGGEEAVARSEVRLRKLHLVRPDLIPYPIAYEVCC